MASLVFRLGATRQKYGGTHLSGKPRKQKKTETGLMDGRFREGRHMGCRFDVGS